MKLSQWLGTGFLAVEIGGLAAIGAALGFGREWLRQEGRPYWNQWLAQERSVCRTD